MQRVVVRGDGAAFFDVYREHGKHSPNPGSYDLNNTEIGVLCEGPAQKVTLSIEYRHQAGLSGVGVHERGAAAVFLQAIAFCWEWRREARGFASGGSTKWSRVPGGSRISR